MEYDLEILVMMVKDETEHDNNDVHDDNYILCSTANYALILYLQCLKMHKHTFFYSRDSLHN